MNPPSLHLESRNGSHQVVYRGRCLYHDGAPRAQAEERARRQVINAHTLVVVASPLFGYGVDLLVARCDASCRVVCLECDPILAELSGRVIAPSLLESPRVVWWLPYSEAHLQAFYTEVQLSDYRRVQMVSLNGGYALNADSYRTVLSILQRAVRVRWQNRLTRLRMGRLWVRNILRNLVVHPPEADIDRLRSDYPVLVVGAGESVEGYVDTVAEYRSRICIVAVDTALPILSAHGIDPDLTVVVEAQQRNIIDLVGVASGRAGGAMALDLSSNPSGHRLMGSRYYQFCSRVAPLAIFRGLREAGIVRSIIPALGSVGCVALYLAMHLSANYIFTVGLDLSYTIGKTHAKGAPQLDWGAWSAQRLNSDPLALFCLARPAMVLKGKNNDRCRTEMNLVGYAEQIRALAATHTGALYDIGTRGLELSIPRIAREKFVSLVQSATTELSASSDQRIYERALTGSSSAETRAHAAARARRFVVDIKNKLHEYTELARGGGASQALRTLERELDFINIDSPVDSSTGHALRSATDYLRRINASLSVI